MNARIVGTKPVTPERQALWDIYGILGFDQDGDPTPAAIANDLAAMVVEAAREYRADGLLDEEGWERSNAALAERVRYLERVLDEAAVTLRAAALNRRGTR